MFDWMKNSPPIWNDFFLRLYEFYIRLTLRRWFVLQAVYCLVFVWLSCTTREKTPWSLSQKAHKQRLGKDNSPLVHGLSSVLSKCYGPWVMVHDIWYSLYRIELILTRKIFYRYNTFRLDTVVETHNHTFVVPSFQRAWLDWTVVSNITLLLIISIALQMTCYSVFLSVYHGSKWNTWVNTEATWVKG